MWAIKEQQGNSEAERDSTGFGHAECSICRSRQASS